MPVGKLLVFVRGKGLEWPYQKISNFFELQPPNLKYADGQEAFQNYFLGSESWRCPGVSFRGVFQRGLFAPLISLSQELAYLLQLLCNMRDVRQTRRAVPETLPRLPNPFLSGLGHFQRSDRARLRAVMHDDISSYSLVPSAHVHLGKASSGKSLG